MKKGMRILLALAVLAPIFRICVYAQQTTTTNCTVNGNSADCTSNTTDYGAQQQRAYEAGQQVGSALGTLIGMNMQARHFRKGLGKYCDAHPGQTWTYRSRSDGRLLSSGRCPSDSDKIAAAENEFVANHRTYIPCPENSQAVAAYIAQNQLDPRRAKSYERAFRELKKAGILKLYKN